MTICEQVGETGQGSDDGAEFFRSQGSDWHAKVGETTTDLDDKLTKGRSVCFLFKLITQLTQCIKKTRQEVILLLYCEASVDRLGQFTSGKGDY